jgi:hypothetical protein
MRIKLITAIGAVVLVATLSSAALAHTLHRSGPVTPGNPAPEKSGASASGDSQDQSADSQEDNNQGDDDSQDQSAESQDDNNQGDDDSQGDTSAPAASDNPTGTSSSEQDDDSQGDQNDQGTSQDD